MQMKTDNGQQDKNARIFVMTEGNMDETSSSLAMIKNYLVDRESWNARWWVTHFYDVQKKSLVSWRKVEITVEYILFSIQ